MGARQRWRIRKAGIRGRVRSSSVIAVKQGFQPQVNPLSTVPAAPRAHGKQPPPTAQHPPEVLVLQLSDVSLLLHQPRPHVPRQRRLVGGAAVAVRMGADRAAAARVAAAGAARLAVGAVGLKVVAKVLALAVAGGLLLASEEEGGGVLIGAIPVQPRLQALHLRLGAAGRGVRAGLAHVGGGVERVADCKGGRVRKGRVRRWSWAFATRGWELLPACCLGAGLTSLQCILKRASGLTISLWGALPKRRQHGPTWMATCA